MLATPQTTRWSKKMSALRGIEEVVDELASTIKTHLIPNFSAMKPPATGPRAGPKTRLFAFKIQLNIVRRITYRGEAQRYKAPLLLHDLFRRIGPPLNLLQWQWEHFPQTQLMQIG
jgi:hypothetical protein